MEKQVDTSNEIQRQRTEHHGDVGAEKQPDDLAGAKEAFASLRAELESVRDQINGHSAELVAQRAELAAHIAQSHGA